MSGCTGPGLLTDLVEGRALAADLRVEFTAMVEASNRAVMADTDEASASAAGEAKQAGETVTATVNKLRPLLQELAYTDEIRRLDEFEHQFSEYRQLNDTVLGLAVENTNLKAQRLLFGPVREAADAFRDALAKATGSHPSKDVDALVTHAVLALREVQVIDARHIAEADEAAMTKMESEISTFEEKAQGSLGGVKSLVPASSKSVDDAAAALDRFRSLNRELITLSRRNSNVRSLALSLGRMRMLTAECAETLQALQDSLAGHSFKATR